MKQLHESYWPATSELLLAESTCGSVLRDAAARDPDRIALIDADRPLGQRRQWTYAELLADSERCARALSAKFPIGTHIAVWSANCPEWVILLFGIALSGLVIVTVNPAYLVGELAYVLRQSRARAIFYQREYRGQTMASVIDQACAIESIKLDLKICFDDFNHFVNSGPETQELPAVQPSLPAMIQYTSGTTGLPKGALLNHYSVTNNARFMAEIKAQDAATINLAVAPLFHTAGCVGGVLGSVQTGGTLLLPSAFDAESMLDLIEQEQVTYTFAVPTMLIALLAAQAHRPRDLSSLGTVFSGGAIVPMEIVKRVETEFSARLIISYGQTETSPAITHTRLTDSAADKSEPIGYAIPQVEIKIVDPETGVTQPVDTSGELCTRGFLVMMGYFEMPDATAATIDRDGWLHTGDLCTMDSRGYCRITGRLKDMIIRGGENIYPREIEEIIYTHPDVADVAVIGIADDYWGEEVAAVVRFELNRSVAGEQLQRFVGTQLARHKVPKHWFALSEIPTTASGKLQKFKLVEQHRAGELDGARI
ncbi:MAG: AMP-binding protein [Proteobacteria bacterium]|nr:AMP-binding protein [Pseudomonadota bacterium]